MKFLFTILLFIGLGAEGQVMFHAHNQMPSGGIIDSFPSDMAFSFRKVREAYSGNCVRIRRSSDNTESDFGFQSSFVDTASIKTFIGSSDAFVVTWYDQSGNSKDVTAPSSSAQPKIATAGVLIYGGGKLCMQYDGSNDVLQRSETIEDEAFSCFMVFIRTTATQFMIVPSFFSSAGAALFIGSTASARAEIGHFASPTYVFVRRGTATNNLSLATGIYYGSTFLGSDGFTNSTNTRSANIGSMDRLAFGSFQRSVGTQYYPGQLHEVFIYKSDKSTDRSTIETNIKNYYGI